MTGTVTNQTVAYIKGVVSPDVAVKNTLDVVELVATSTGVGPLVVPRAMVSDGTHLYVGQSSAAPATWPNTQSAVLWKIKASGNTVIDAQSLNLNAILGTVDRVRDLAQNATYLFAACWDSGHVAIINKATWTVVGWGNCGLNQRVISVSVGTDPTGIEDHFYVYTDDGAGGTFIGVQQFTTSSCIGALPDTVGPVASLATLNAGMLRYGGGTLWLTNGGNVAQAALTQISIPYGLAVANSTPTLGVDSSSLLAVYAFGSVWVSSGDIANTVYRVNATTLAVEATITLSTGSFVTGMTVGPDNLGVADQWLYCSVSNYSRMEPINPVTNATMGSSVLLVINRCYEGVAVIGDDVYFACFGSTTGNSSEGNPGIDYFNPVTITHGATTALVEQTAWTQRYRTIGGDVLGPITALTTTKLHGTPVNTVGTLGQALTVQQTDPPFLLPSSIVWDTTGNQLLVVEGILPGATFPSQVGINTYDPTTGKYTKYNNIGWDPCLGHVKVVCDATHAFVVGRSAYPGYYGVTAYARGLWGD